MVTEALVRKRILSALEDKNLTVNSLGSGNSAKCQKLFNQLLKNKTLTMDVVSIVLNEIPDLNAEWLFRGAGVQFKSQSSIEDQINDLNNRLSVLEGEREKQISTPEKCLA